MPSTSDDGEKQNVQHTAFEIATVPIMSSSIADEEAPRNKSQKETSGFSGKPGPGGKPGGGLPPNHPMHPSQFSGDRWDRQALLTLLGCFCVMFCSFGWINCESPIERT